jgi:hypothetical protein
MPSSWDCCRYTVSGASGVAEGIRNEACMAANQHQQNTKVRAVKVLHWQSLATIFLSILCTPNGLIEELLPWNLAGIPHQPQTRS